EEALHPVEVRLHEHAATELVVEAAVIALADVCLVAADLEFRRIARVVAPELDAAVSAREAELEAQDEVLVRLVRNEEGVVTEAIGTGRADDRPIADRPILRLSRPTGEGFAIEDPGEAARFFPFPFSFPLPRALRAHARWREVQENDASGDAPAHKQPSHSSSPFDKWGQKTRTSASRHAPREEGGISDDRPPGAFGDRFRIPPIASKGQRKSRTPTNGRTWAPDPRAENCRVRGLDGHAAA